MESDDLTDVLRAFAGGVAKLYKTRPYWLIEEALIRSVFVDALLDSPYRSNEWAGPEDICLERTVWGGKKIDLVAMHKDGASAIAVEFKSWNVVTKHNGKRPYSTNVTRSKAEAQLESIRKDVGKLAELECRDVRLVPMIVICAQHELELEHFKQYTGRTRREQEIDFIGMLENEIKRHQRWINRLPDNEPFSCKCETKFGLWVFEVIGKGRRSGGAVPKRTTVHPEHQKSRATSRRTPSTARVRR